MALGLMNLLAVYGTPTLELIEIMGKWLYLQFDSKNNERFARNTLYIFEAKKKHKDIGVHYWIPSTYEIFAHFHHLPLRIYVSFGTDSYPADVESHMTVGDVIAIMKATPFLAEETDQFYYWLYKSTDETVNFEQALPNEAHIYALIAEFVREKEMNQKLNEEEDELQSTPEKCVFALRRRIYQLICRSPDEYWHLSETALKQMFFQCKDDYIIRGILNHVIPSEDIAKLASYQLCIINRARLLRSKDGVLKQEYVRKQLLQAIPKKMAEEKRFEVWFTKINTFFESNNLKDLSVEECMREWLAIYSKSDIAMSSYFTLIRFGMEGLKIPRDSICVVNISGIYFLEEDRKQVFKIELQNLVTVKVNQDRFTLSYLDSEIELNTTTVTFCTPRAREIVEDILVYAQVNMIEYRYSVMVNPSQNAAVTSRKGGRSEITELSEVVVIRGNSRPMKSIMYSIDEKPAGKQAGKVVDLDAYKTGLMQYKIKKDFLIYQQVFPLYKNLRLGAGKGKAIRRGKRIFMTNAETQIIEEEKEEESFDLDDDDEEDDESFDQPLRKTTSRGKSIRRTKGVFKDMAVSGSFMKRDESRMTDTDEEGIIYIYIYI